MYNRSRNTVHYVQVKDGTYRTYTGLALKGSSWEWLVSYESRSLQFPQPACKVDNLFHIKQQVQVLDHIHETKRNLD